MRNKSNDIFDFQWTFIGYEIRKWGPVPYSGPSLGVQNSWFLLQKGSKPSKWTSTRLLEKAHAFWDRIQSHPGELLPGCLRERLRVKEDVGVSSEVSFDQRFSFGNHFIEKPIFETDTTFNATFRVDTRNDANERVQESYQLSMIFEKWKFSTTSLKKVYSHS